MGDRANVVIDDNGSQVYLYTHWRGTELPEIVRKALTKNQSWDDPQYLSRIVFQEMLGGDTGTTGFGISAIPGYGRDKIIILDCTNQQVKIKDKMISFADFVKLEEATW